MKSNILVAIQHDISRLDSNMSVTNVLLCEYMQETFFKTYHVEANEYLRDFMCIKLSQYLQKHFLQFVNSFEDEPLHLINSILMRSSGIVADLKKYKKDAELSYFFQNIYRLYEVELFETAI